jgi:hypothetical protein
MVNEPIMEVRMNPKSTKDMSLRFSFFIDVCNVLQIGEGGDFGSVAPQI